MNMVMLPELDRIIMLETSLKASQSITFKISKSTCPGIESIDEDSRPNEGNSVKVGSGTQTTSGNAIKLLPEKDNWGYNIEFTTHEQMITFAIIYNKVLDAKILGKSSSQLALSNNKKLSTNELHK